MKYSLGISNFLEEISSLSHSVVFLYFFALITVAAAAKSLQSCQTLCDPIDAAPQSPPSLGFSRQEYGSGAPLPSLIDRWGRLSYLSWLFFGTLHSNGNIFPFLLCFSLPVFSQLFIRPPQTAILLFCISFFGDGLDSCLLYNVMNLHL